MESRLKDEQRESSSSNRIMDSQIPIETSLGTFTMATRRSKPAHHVYLSGGLWFAVTVPKPK